MAIYTRTGDKGETRLFGGYPISKNDLRVHAYGSVDELNSFVGLLVSEIDVSMEDVLLPLARIQQELFDCGSDLATIRDRRPYKVRLDASDWLELLIDEYAEEVPPVTKFTIPGGAKAASLAQVCRTVTRRVERLVVGLMEEDEMVNQGVLIYLNRLSDYFYILGRLLNYRSGQSDVLYERSRDIFGTGKVAEKLREN
ncbi:ATP:cob(I)alamin adenosyltransferase [Suicoccus acidiformans]|uniref:Corrinoid adenosyltransferase n=1 Tax=Suicoccus acidiformans TaxID=2036206 RepID=A0A347WM09_9LACT|nr:cob(I)yrinic acid a,c-diamide adenosyltransferase [Suicoccus acidiformans]AXY26116.1 ATP:cob(I)alamin adenosyltransferase [Suicoccus acidiformans]